MGADGAYDAGAIARRSLLRGAGAATLVAASLGGTGAAEADVPLLGRRYQPGISQFTNVVADANLTTVAGGLRTVRVEVPAANQVPFGAGTQLVVGIPASSSLVQVAGVRIGYSGNGAVNLRQTPIRAYDSRSSGGLLAAGTKRTVTLSDVLCPAGTSAMIVNLTAIGAAAGGYVKLYSGVGPRPSTSSMNYAAGPAIANCSIVEVSTARQLKVYTIQTTHFIIDVLGTVS